jgi:hypothetical protein
MLGKLIGHAFASKVPHPSSGKRDNKTPLATAAFPDNEHIHGRQENTAQIRDMCWGNQ